MKMTFTLETKQKKKATWPLWGSGGLLILCLGLLMVNHQAYSSLSLSNEKAIEELPQYLKDTFYTNLDYDLEDTLEETREKFTHLNRCVLAQGEYEYEHFLNQKGRAAALLFGGAFSVLDHHAQSAPVQPVNPVLSSDG